MSTRKNTQNPRVTPPQWLWFRRLARWLFTDTVRELVDQHQAENLAAVFRQHGTEVNALDRRITERFDLCQEIIAQNVRKLRDEQTEFAGHFTAELANLRRGLLEQER